MNSTPASSQAVASSGLIGREASAMAGASSPPAQNSAKPSPVPGPSTVAAISEQSRSFSPTAVEMGSTVEEPVTVSSPLVSAGQSLLSPEPDVVSVEEPSSSPHAAA